MFLSLFPKKEEFVKEVFSPNKRIKVIVRLKRSRIFYEVMQDEKVLIKKSFLEMVLLNERPLRDDLRLIRTQTKRLNETFEMPWGEDREIENSYNELALYFTETKVSKRIFTLRFRVFDTGLAFRYEIPAQPKFQQVIVADEISEFNLDLNTVAWKIPAFEPDRYEYNYEKCTVYDLKQSVHTPLTLKTIGGYYLSIHEAALYNYGSMTIKLGLNSALVSDITPLSDGTRAKVALPFQTPWRVVMIADSAAELTKNRLIYCLNEPPARDFSWVKTLKFLGIWWAMYVGEWTWAPGERHGATTEHAYEYIDEAVKLGVSGLLIEGWNQGWEGDWLENGINNKFTIAEPDFDLPAVARYAHENNVELVGHHETVGFVDNYENQLEEAYQYYAANGIHYVKTGYAGSKMMIHGKREYHHSQLGVLHYQKTVELAAKYGICLDIHEPIKGTGIERTWPNLLTREGARGQEYEGGALSPSHACFLPYTRLLAGGMDYTNGIFDLTNSVKRISTTLARQLAYFVTIYSGMAMAADRPYIYARYPEAFQFIRDVPVNYEKTLPLLGEIGEYYIVARKDRNSSDWYIGGVTNETAREVHLDLSFLDEAEPGMPSDQDNATYVAQIYADGENAHFRDNPHAISITTRRVKKGDFLDLWLAPGGGFAVQLKKI